jgi:hypothetical protein
MEQKWKDIDRGKPRVLRETCLSANLSTTTPTWTAMGANPGLRGEKPATNRLSCGTAIRTCLARAIMLQGYIIMQQFKMTAG